MTDENFSADSLNRPTGTSESAIPLVIAEDVRYNCQGCGRCCTGWAVGMTEEDYAKVKDVDWGSLHPDLANKELFVHREQEFAQGLSVYAHHTKARADGSCPFLIENRCFIHSTLGEENKPRMCQLFPYTFVATPSGIFVGVTNNSMAAVRNLGEPLTEQRPMLERMWKQMVAQERAQGKASDEVAAAAQSVSASDLAGIKFDINLTPGVPLTWDEYLLLEARMQELIKGVEYPNIFMALIAISDILVEAVRLKSAGSDLSTIPTFKCAPERWIKSEPGYFEQKVFSLLCFKNFVWPQIREANEAAWGTSGTNPLSDSKVISAAVNAVLFDKMDIKGAGTVSIGKAKKYKVVAFTPEIMQFFRRALYLKIFSKAYCGTAISGLSLVAGYNNIVAGFLSALIYAKAHALSKNSPEVGIADLYEGFFVHDKEGTALSQLDKGKAGFFDAGFSSPRLFTRLLGQMSKTVAN